MSFCKGCGLSISDKEAQMVAHWAFCQGCFDNLMARKEGAASEARPVSYSPAESPQAQTATCSLCESPVSEGEGHSMLGLLFCDGCHGSLVEKPAAKSRPEPEEQPIPRVPQEMVDTSLTLACTGCGRTIPALGAKERDGGHYCPECWYGAQDT